MLNKKYSNKKRINTYLTVRGIIILTCIISLILFPFQEIDYNKQHWQSFFQSVPLIILLVIFFYEKFEAPFFLQIMQVEDKIQINSFFPSFKSLFYTKKSINKVIVEESDTIQVLLSTKYGFLQTFQFKVIKKSGTIYLSKRYSTKWVDIEVLKKNNFFLNPTNIIQ